MFKIEQFFLIDHTPEELKVGLTSIHFGDQVATWHQSLMQTDVGSEGIVEYHNKFEQIGTRVQLSEEYLFSSYLAGLRKRLGVIKGKLCKVKVRKEKKHHLA
ncbi:hypothetical protein V2J09_011071 [Rumex salicifolius]